MEIALSPRPTKGPAGNSPIDPRDEPGQSALGRSAHPRRTAQTRDRRRTNLGGQIYGETQKTAFTRMENLSAQPCRWHRGDGPVCRSDTLFSIALWLADYARPTPDVMARRDDAPDRRMDRPTTYRSLRLGPRAEIHRSFSPRYNRRRISTRIRRRCSGFNTIK